MNIKHKLRAVIASEKMGATSISFLRIVETVDEYGRAVLDSQSFITTANVQPAPGKERELLPEELRGMETLLIFSLDPLLVNSESGAKDDIIIYNNQEYTVRTSERWVEHGIYKAIATSNKV